MEESDFTLIESNGDHFAETAVSLTADDWKTIYNILQDRSPKSLEILVNLIITIHNTFKKPAHCRSYEMVDMFIKYIKTEKPAWAMSDEPIEFKTIENAFEDYCRRVIPPDELFRVLDKRLYNSKLDFASRIRDGECISINILDPDNM